MNMFTLNQLNKIFPIAAKSGRTNKFYPYLLEYMKFYDIRSLERMSCFLANIAVESGELRYTKEIWGPTAVQLRYEGRVDLGNDKVGDGKKFMGRGLIQVTGKYNYKMVGRALNLDLLTHPELLETPEYATISACWWWHANGCNEIADGYDPILRTSKRVNLGNPDTTRLPNGWEERYRYYNEAKRVLSTPDFGNVVAGVQTHYEN